MERTRQAILDAAWDLVASRGADVSLAEIGRAAGISRQSVYLHFGSRGGLLMALVRRADDRFGIRQKMFDRFAVADPRARLDGVIDVWLDFVVQIRPVATDLIRLRSTDPDASAAWEDRMAELRAWLGELTASLARDGALAGEWRAAEAADYLWAAFSVPVWTLLVQDCGWSGAHARQVLRRTIADSLLGPAA